LRAAGIGASAWATYYLSANDVRSPLLHVLGLNEIESLPGPGTLRWIPVLHALGIRAFGCNAYVAAEAGTTVLSFGGPPTFTPSAWEWAFRVSALMRSERGRGR
jgi:hypothetical protein